MIPPEILQIAVIGTTDVLSLVGMAEILQRFQSIFTQTLKKLIFCFSKNTDMEEMVQCSCYALQVDSWDLESYFH